MIPKKIETVLSLVFGMSAAAKRTFTSGTPVPAFGVGRDAEWKVEASGVEAIHLYLAFDGRHLHVAAPTGASALLDATPIGSQWTPVPVGAELRFGAAVLRVSCESAEPRERAARVPELDGAARTITSGQTLPLRGRPASQLPVQQTSATLPLPGRAGSLAPPASRTLAIQRPQPRLVPVPVVAVPLAAAPGPIARGVPASPAATPLPSTPIAAVRAPIGVVPAARLALETPRADCAHTVSDEGALRDLAARVAQGIAAASAAPPADPNATHARGPTHSAANALEVASARPAAAPGPWGSSARAPNAPTNPPPPGARNAPAAGAPKSSGIVAAWTRTSWPKRATIVLLPFAGYFGVLGARAQPPSGKRTEPAKLARATASARETPAPRSTQETPLVTVAAPAVTAPAPTSSTRRNSAEVGLTPPSVADRPDVHAMPPDVATASPTPAADAAPARVQRDALMAAFEGDLAHAARLYDRLATGPDARVYSLAARFSRERAVRKP